MYNEFLKFIGCYFKKNIIFSLYFEEYVCCFSAAYGLQSTALDSDCGLFHGYQMPVEKHKGPNACLRLLREKLNNLTELGIRADIIKDRTQNTVRVHPGAVLSLPALYLTQFV